MTRRMLTDEEVEAYIDEVNERELATWESREKVDESVTVISVHGRLANVRWMEELGAKKQKAGKFFEYELDVPTKGQETIDLFRRLQRAEGVWFDTSFKMRKVR